MLLRFLGMFFDVLDWLQLSSHTVGTVFGCRLFHRIKMLTRVFGNIGVLQSYVATNVKTLRGVTGTPALSRYTYEE